MRRPCAVLVFVEDRVACWTRRVASAMPRRPSVGDLGAAGATICPAA
ncbi:hypothetical protein HNP84_004224 [Thermocatellispora tengchongensis]|uniref:Uncharacterized protein n=1 Tax=Thermocatellispora tengchongensis TaxID=1073253 RepID=A0A840P567_9ACTN|nr:hypothetical protein [Thermocatellispora tengchongensis]MBB5134492.1 hypothetical protein [Thermocatellispora tengchongensis]